MRSLFVIFILVQVFLIDAQPPQKFYCRYGGEGVDIGYSVKETYNRSYIIIGSTSSFGAGGTDAFMLLVDSMGNLTWQKTFGGLGNDVGKSIIINPVDSGFVFAGYTSSFGSGGYDFYLVRTDKNGNKIWERNYGGNDWDFGVDVCLASDGDIVIGGNSPNPLNNLSNDCLILKVKSQTGDIVWQKKIGGQEEENFQKIKRTSDGLFTILFNSKSYGDLNGDIVLYKLGVNSDSIASKIIGKLNKTEVGYDFIEDKNNDLVVCGAIDTSKTNWGSYQCYVLKTKMTGTLIAEQQFGGAGNEDRFFSITDFKKRNKYYFSRRVFHPSFGIDIQPVVLDYFFVYNASVTYGFEGNDEAFQIISTIDNGAVMIGSAKQNSGSNSDVFLVKLDSTGYNTNEITSSKQIEMLSNDKAKLYYNNFKLFFDKSLRNHAIEIINQLGEVVQRETLNDTPLNLKGLKSKEIYFIVIDDEEPIRLKFVTE